MPDTGWVTVGADGGLVLHPFRTYTSDADGRVYAAAHGVDFPFPDDCFDAPRGEARPLELGPGVVSTGLIIINGAAGQLADHVVGCDEFRHAPVDRIPVAVWTKDGAVLQLSELYRP